MEDHTLKKVYIHLFMNHISRAVNQWREVLKNSNQSTFTLEHREEHKLQICQIEGGVQQLQRTQISQHEQKDRESVGGNL